MIGAILGRIKTWLILALSAAVAILAIVAQSERLGRARDKLKAVSKAKDVQEKATDVITEGERKREEIQNADDADMSRFGDQ